MDASSVREGERQRELERQRDSERGRVQHCILMERILTKIYFPEFILQKKRQKHIVTVTLTFVKL